MIRIFKTENGLIHQKDELSPGSWIALTNPTATEILEIANTYGIDPDDLRAPLDEEERSRLKLRIIHLILVDIPSIEERNDKDWYVTIPWHHHNGRGHHHGLPGRDTGTGGVYGRPCERFPYVYEDQVHSAGTV